MTFNQLKQFEVEPDKSVKYSLTEIQMNGQTPFLMVKPATEANKPFARAQLLRSNKRVANRGGRGVSLETIENTRDDDKELYPRFVITGWGNVFDDTGKEVPFSLKSCEEFLAALPNWVFDNLRQHCTTPTNFAGMTVDDMNELGN
jgi:hypothetical protein